MKKKVNGKQVDMTPEEEAEFLAQQAADSQPPDLEAEVQKIADDLTQGEERMMALALATVDLKMADTSGMNLQQVRKAFRDRVVHYLRQRRGI